MRENRRTMEYIGLVILIGLYAAAVIITPRAARSDDMLIIGNARLPVSAFAGVFSSIANICIICLAVFYRKQGFIIALCALLSQTPYWIWNSIAQKSLSSVPGLFSTLLTVIALTLIRSRDKQIGRYREAEVKQLTQQRKLSERLFEQTARALVTAIDAKDEYSHGHSVRVAEYSERIARMMGKSDEECKMVYYAGLLHDVGKIGISDSIINKKEELTQEEYEEIMRHPELGNQILSSIQDYPYISLGAHYHHERYDGKGYPDGLKGDDIPEIARIIAVADAYDTMSSNRSYRRAIPQQIIREEIIAGAGTQFDPEIAMIMRHLIDLDGEYRMKEQETVRELAGSRGMHCTEYRSEISAGVLLSQSVTRIHLTYRDEKPKDNQAAPVIILFDSLDTRVHNDEQTRKNLNYFEYAEIWLNGEAVNHGVREIETTITEHHGTMPPAEKTEKGKAVYDVEAVKCRDHVLLVVDDGRKVIRVTVALPDSSRFAYIALTGKDCYIGDVHIEKAAETVPDDYIPRIAEEISYIDGPEGDIPNIQVDGVRSMSSEGVPVRDGMKMTFHTMSLPTARLIWHCPYVVLYRAADGKVNGEGYTEYTAIRLDGENWENQSSAENRIIVNREDDFGGWDAWKNGNREGYDCTVLFRLEGNKVTVSTTNLGLSVKNITILPDVQEEGDGTLYTALTGDQCAITNIRIS